MYQLPVPSLIRTDITGINVSMTQLSTFHGCQMRLCLTQLAERLRILKAHPVGNLILSATEHNSNSAAFAKKLIIIVDR